VGGLHFKHRSGRGLARLAFLGAAIVCAHLSALAASASGDDRPPSIADSFDSFWAAAHDQSFEDQQALWDHLVEQPRYDVYASVVWEEKDHPHWRDDKIRLLKQRFAEYPSDSGRIAHAARRLEADISPQTTRFRTVFPGATANPQVRVILAPNFDARSGVLTSGTPVLVFAIDSLVMEHADMRVVFPHELFHLYHATHAGVQNDGVMPGADLTLPLFAEGMATYVSSVLAPNRSDGQLLLQNDLGSVPASRLTEVAARFLTDADAKAIDSAHPDAFKRWFAASDKSYQRDLPNRSGYWLGLQVIRHLRRQYSVREMASWPPATAQTRTRAALREIAHQ
jgi:hypothetical protein